MNLKPLTPPCTPFWGVVLSALRGKYIFEKRTQQQICHGCPILFFSSCLREPRFNRTLPYELPLCFINVVAP